MLGPSVSDGLELGFESRKEPSGAHRRATCTANQRKTQKSPNKSYRLDEGEGLDSVLGPGGWNSCSYALHLDDDGVHHWNHSKIHKLGSQRIEELQR